VFWLSRAAACDSPCRAIEELPEDQAILAIGDSVLGIHYTTCEGVPGQLATVLGNRITSFAVPDRPVSSPSGSDDIQSQYTSASWDWVLMSGGVNDLIQECRCNANVDEAACAQAIDELISEDGTRGEIPTLAERALADGARVMLVGYYNVPDDAALNFDACAPQVTELTERYRAFTTATEGVEYFIGLRPMNVWIIRTPKGCEFDTSAVMLFGEHPERFFWDRIHPSPTGAHDIAVEVAALMQRIDAQSPE